jgi:hypothetical protein
MLALQILALCFQISTPFLSRVQLFHNVKKTYPQVLQAVSEFRLQQLA